jgi:hypothetical protein
LAYYNGGIGLEIRLRIHAVGAAESNKFDNTMRTVPRSELERLSLDPAAISLIPESVARDSLILPVSVKSSGLYLIVPLDAGLVGNFTFRRLDYILKTPYTFDYADRSDLSQVVGLFYTAVYAEIENCSSGFLSRCPKRFAELMPTDDPTVRFCSVCNRKVYFCWSEAEVEQRAQRGECAAIMHRDEPNRWA